MKARALVQAALLVALIAGSAIGQTPLGTDFTYQGRLQLSGSPVNGTADLQLKLFNALAGGSQVGSTQSFNNVAVADGLFTVDVNFGAAALNGEARWLEIAVRSPAGSGVFTTLTPREPLTGTPYAIQTRGIFVDASNHVGIGTTAPMYPLSLGSSTPTTPKLALYEDATGTDTYGFGIRPFALTFWANGAERMRISSTAAGWGALGIGTTSPLASGLHVVGEPTGPGGTLALEGTTHTYIALYPDGAAAGRKGFIGYPCGSCNDISITNTYTNGNISLSPGPGGVTSTTVLQITGADLAEKFPTTEKIEPGMVVAIDPDHAGQLCLAKGAYNPRVAGVVSGANDFSVGVVLGNLPGREDASPIALSGRVYVWCDATKCPIQPGDLLTTSDMPGHAMKVTDPGRAAGAIVGKAMESLDSDQGLVLVLVTLQ